jgi:uncharacterized protein YjbI with pentapeptide repeats
MYISPDRFMRNIPPGYLREWVSDNVLPIKQTAEAAVSAMLQAILAQHTAWLNGQKGGKRADLSGWNIAALRVDMNGVDLSRAILTGATLNSTDFRGAKFTGAKLNNTVMYDADLSDADLSGADLRNANLMGANLRRSNLQNVNATKAKFDGAAMIDADITGAKGREIEIAHNKGFFGSEKSVEWGRRQLSTAKLK